MSAHTQVTSTETVASRSERLANGLAFVMLAMGISWYGLRNLTNNNFWSDEASSFYTALGWPPPGESAGSLGDAWYWTLTTHVEPGLFNLMERFWALMFGTEIYVLRLMPFVLFLVYLAAAVAVGRLVQLPWFLAVAAAAMVLLENITPYYGVELRPSIAGLAASVALPAIGIWFLRSPSLMRLVAMVLGVLFFGSMQFNSLPVLVALGAMLLVGAGWTQVRSSRVRVLVAASIAVAWQPVVYLVSRGNPLQATGESSLSAIPDTLIPNMETSRVLEVLATNFVSATALPRTIFVIAVPALWLFSRIEPPWRKGPGFALTINGLWIFVVAATCGAAALGFRGVMPWIVGTRWSIAEIGLIAVSLVGLGGLLAHFVPWRRSPLRIIVIVGALAVTAVGSLRLATYERPPGVDWRPALEIILSGNPGGTVIDLWTYPEIRYWVELSGDYEDYRQGWLQHEVQPSPGSASADADNVLEFLNSDADRFLLRSQEVLDGVELPESIEIVPLSRTGGDSTSRPLLLVK